MNFNHNSKGNNPVELEKVLDRVSDAIVALDTHWIYTYVNEKAAQTFGRTPEQMIGKHIWTEFPEGIGQPFYKAYYRAVETQQVITLEEYYPPYDRWFENRIFPSTDGLTIFFSDITEKKKAEQTVRDTNLYNRLLFDHSPIGLALCRTDGSLVDVNEVLAKIIGYTRDETLNLTYWDITPEKYKDQEQIQLNSLATQGEYGLYEKEYIHKDGHLVPVLLSGLIVEITNERFILSTVEDLTHRKRVDQISRQQEAFIDSLANTIPAIIYIYDLETQSNIYSNDGIQQLLQFSPQEILEMGSGILSRLIHPQDLPAVIAFQNELENAHDDGVLEFEYRMQDSKGVWHWLHSYERPFLRNPNGTLKQKIGIAIDITERIRIEHQIELERYFSDEVLESLPGIFYMYDEKLHFYRWNKNFETVSGYRADEIMHMSPLDFFSGQEKDLLAERISEVFSAGSSSVVADFVAKDGTHTPHYFTGDLVKIEEKMYMIGVGIDITEQIRAQSTAQNNEQILRQVIEHTPAAIAMFDLDMRYIAYSDRFLIDYGLKDQNLVGKSHYEIFPEISSQWKEIHQRCLEGAMERAEADPFPRQDGNIDYVRWEIRPWYEKSREIGGVILFSEVITESVNASRALLEAKNLLQAILDNSTALVYVKDKEGRFTFANKKIESVLGQPAGALIGRTTHDFLPKTIADSHRKNDLEVFVNQIPITFEEINEEPEGKHTYLSVKFPLFDSNGVMNGVCGISTDISDRVRADEEIRLITARLAEIQEIERKLIAKELHDRVGQNLSVLSISLNMIRSQLQQPESNALASQFEDTQELITEITDQIREVISELHPPVLEDYGLAAAIRWYADRISKHTGLKIDVEGDVIEPRLDISVSMALYRIFQEALTNISKHAKASTAKVALSGYNDKIELTIEDNGIGFDSTQPARSSKPHWGFGIMQERARAIGGKLTIQSYPEIGTKITVSTPRTNNENINTIS